MPYKSLIIVALAAFSLGIAADRLLLTSNSSTTDAVSLANGAHLTATVPTRIPGAGDDLGQVPSSNGARNIEDSDDENNAGTLTVEQLLERFDRGKPVNFSTASQLVDQLPAGRKRFQFIERLASHWGRKDPRAAISWAEELNGREKSIAMERILHEWARANPLGASNYVSQLPNSERNLHMVRSMAHIWAEQDRTAAMEWGMAQSDPATRQYALGGTLEVWASNDPAAAAAFVSSLDEASERHRLLGEVARHWTGQNTSEAMEWAQGLPGEDRERATRSIFRELAEHDPGLAASMYEELTLSLPEGRIQEREYRHMAQEIASRWSASDPIEAAAWAMGLPEKGNIQQDAIRDVADHWLRLDSIAASEWIVQLPEGGSRDAAAERVVDQINRSDPETAFAWATSIGDEGHRTDLMHRVLEGWNATDPGAARAAFDSVNVPPDRQRHFNEIFGADVVPEGDTSSGDAAESN
ncbi:MAG: hypothetical protein ACI9R3_005224 [Verrucomicrobiales bacterium]|jgi:hypothetical protein